MGTVIATVVLTLCGVALLFVVFVAGAKSLEAEMKRHEMAGAGGLKHLRLAAAILRDLGAPPKDIGYDDIEVISRQHKEEIAAWLAAYDKAMKKSRK